MGLGLAGLGVHGLRYAEHLLAGDVAGARLTAICRGDVAAGRRYADEHGLVCTATVAELAAHPTVDAVVLALPPDRHGPAALACLQAGRAVLVEKPLASERAAAEELAAAVRRTGTPLMVAQTLRFDPLIEALKREIPGLGSLCHLSIHQRFEPSSRAWLDRPGPGGILLNTGVHGFDLLRHLTGLEPASVTCQTRRGVTRNTDDQFAATFRLEPGGVLATVDNARSTRSRSGRIEVVGGDGQMWGDHVHRTLTRVRGRSLTELGPIPAQPTIPATVDAFVRALRDGKPLPVTVADGLATLKMVEAAGRSASGGCRESID